MKGGTHRERRRWMFGSAVFDETSWTLHVDGQLRAIEGKPLALLLELLQSSGETISKDELMERVWPGVFVADASLTTAMRKLRKAIGDDSKDHRIIETVSGVGYRLIAEVAVEHVIGNPSLEIPSSRITDASAASAGKSLVSQGVAVWRSRSAGMAVLGFLGLALVATTSLIAPKERSATSTVNPRDALAALRRLDTETIVQMSKAGWDPNKPFDKDGNVPLGVTVEMCEWYPGHDREQLLLMVRTLYDAGAKIDVRNVWGDTPYSIAKAERYCGPDHPVTKMMQIECFSGENPLGDRCLATYEIARRYKERTAHLRK